MIFTVMKLKIKIDCQIVLQNRYLKVKFTSFFDIFLG